MVFLIRMSDDERRGERISQMLCDDPTGTLFEAYWCLLVYISPRYLVQHWYFVMVYRLNELRLISSRGGFCVKVCRHTTEPNLCERCHASVSASPMRSPPTLVPHPSSVPQFMSGWLTVRLSQAIHRLRENSIDLCSEVVGALWARGGGDKVLCVIILLRLNRFGPALSLLSVCMWDERKGE